MRIVIAGGSGFIGTALTRVLLADGHQVIVLTRRPEQARLPVGAQAVGWNLDSPAGWGQVVDGAGAVINLVGENLGGGLWTADRKKRIRESRVRAGQALVAAVETVNRRPEVLVQASGIGYYGFTGNTPVTESSPPGSDFLARVSVDWEDSTRPVEALGVRRVITRNSLVLHGQEGIFPLVLLTFRLFVGGPVGSGQQWFPWIHLDDQVHAILHLINTSAASGAYDFAAPDAVTNAQLGKTIARVLHRPYYFPVPAFAMRAVLGELSTLVLEGQRAHPTRLLESGYRFRFPTLEGALRDLVG